MKPTIGLITFEPQLPAIVRSLEPKLNEEIEAIHIAQPNPINDEEIITAATTLAEICDILITRPIPARLLNGRLSIPIVTYPITFRDILESLYRAQKKGNLVGLILPANGDCDLGCWPEILGITVIKELYQSRKDMMKAIASLKAKGVNVIVGGGLVEKYATTAGLEHEIMQTSGETALQHIRKAIDIVQAIHQERHYLERVQALLDVTHEGIILLNKGGNITYVNNSCSQILKLTKSSLVGKQLYAVLENTLTPESNTAFKNTFSNQITDRCIGKLLHLRDGTAILCNMAPINTSEGDTVVAFIEASQLQKMEYGVRHQLAARGLKAKFSLDDIIGKSAALERAKLQARAFAATDSTVLIYGETGTGKELFAHAMHQLGNRRQHPFIAINCSALPKELIESELFGYEEGAFTGARKKGKQGLFELAHGGTIFLDEIGTLPLDVQTKLLRVIQEKEVIRLGASQIIPVDVRIIAATNRDLEEEVQKGSFREDLFYRLNVLSLQLPPLRERGEDVLLLFNHFFGEFCRRFGFNLAPPEIEEQQLLLAYHWPGNIRELRNFTERYVVLGSYSSDTAGLLKNLYAELKRCQDNSQPPKTNNPVLWLGGSQEDKKASAGKRELPAGNGASDAQKQQQTPAMGEIIHFLNLTEREFLGAIGEKFNWRKKAMAAALGVSTTTLWRRLKKTGLTGRHK